jgi:hypothetical protein
MTGEEYSLLFDHFAAVNGQLAFSRARTTRPWSPCTDEKTAPRICRRPSEDRWGTTKVILAMELIQSG